ncbi:MAG TPA: neutral/alkaline non-lysosomal ceramidase N-terminal domain-containing protein [Bryobacteraceae bacterium]|nr:neutral/alkaline non-lysosomal ceramidase N-terminal domain-containing protein [Bryobacteraceae bacterium]
MNQQVRAGFAKIDITPPLDSIDAHGIGYWYQRAVRFTGVRDPLFVRTLVAGEGNFRQVIISVDSIFDSFGFSEDASARISLALGIDESRIFITCTHTHSSPLIDRNNTRRGVEYGSFVADRIVHSAMKADRNGVNATVSVCAGAVRDVLYNRRPLLSNGRVAELHVPATPGSVVDAGPVNDTMTIVKFRRDDGQFIGGFCHFGIHGVAVQCSDLLSSDCMGRAIQAVEREAGNDLVLLHLNGPCGDIDPILMGDDKSLDIMTSDLADGIREVANEKEEPLQKPMSLRAFRGTFRALRRETRPAVILESERQALSRNADGAADIRHHSGAGYESFVLAEEHAVGTLPDEFEVPYQILRWGGLVLVGIGGEIFTYFGLALRAAWPGLLILPVGLTGGAKGYLPAQEMFQQGGYEVTCAQWCPVAPGETEKLFAQLTGDLKSVVRSEAA